MTEGERMPVIGLNPAFSGPRFKGCENMLFPPSANCLGEFTGMGSLDGELGAAERLTPSTSLTSNELVASDLFSLLEFNPTDLFWFCTFGNRRGACFARELAVGANSVDEGL